MALQACSSLIRPYASNPAASDWIFAICKRQQSTFRRTRKALKVKPDPSFAPTKVEARDHIVFNPPSSAPNVYHTPLLFMPQDDPRRIQQTAILRAATSSASAKALPTKGLGKPKPLFPEKTYNVTEDQVEEIRKLRTEDPVHWTRVRLAKKFQCSSFFISLCVKSPSAGARHAAKLEEIKAKWGRGRTAAREEREARYKLWGRD